MSYLRVLPEVPLNEKRLEQDIGEKMFLGMISENSTLLLEGILESFEPNFTISLENCKVIYPEKSDKFAGIINAPFIWKKRGIQTVAEEAKVVSETFEFRGIIYNNNMISGGNLNNANSCRIYQMIKLFLDKEITIDRFKEFKKKMEKEERDMRTLNNISINKRINRKGGG